MADKNFEWLTEEICLEYKRRADMLYQNAGQDIGEWRKLREELPKNVMLQKLKRITFCGVKKHIADYEEPIFQGYGHGQKMIGETEDYLDEIRKTLSGNI